jgi:signal recognition particle subunit SRP54
MGPLSGVLGMMPGIPKEVKNAQIDDREIARVEAIIRSMTPAERVDPDLIDQSRRVRIANGSGTEPARVGELVKQFKEMSKMMKRMGGAGTKRLTKSRRKAAKGKSKGPGGRTSGAGRVAPKAKAPLRLPDFEAGRGGGRPGGGLGLPGLPGGPDSDPFGLG